MPPADLFDTDIGSTERETGTRLAPRFDADGLLACIAIDAASREVLMMAWMNEKALSRTIETGVVHYWSRSRGTLWKKGETSGQLQTVQRLRIDCDQDVILAEVTVGGDGGACHTGARSCFYREIDPNPSDPGQSTLKPVK